MAREKYKFRMYEKLAAEAQSILDEAQKSAIAAAKLPAREPAETRPAPQSSRRSDDDYDKTIEAVGRIRELVKEVYGDSYDACPTATTGAGLALARMCAVSGTQMEASRGRHIVLTPRMKPSELLAGCYPLPPKYRVLPEFMAPATYAGPSQNLYAAIVPLSGATYGYHGIIPAQVPMVANSLPVPSLEAMAATAESCMPILSAVFASGTGVPGCGFARANDDGLPELHAGLGELASEYGVPLILDNTSAIPFLGPDPVKMGASAVVYGPHGPGRVGLVVGEEEVLVPMLQVAGVAKRKPGETGHILPDLQRLLDLASFLAEVRENPERYTRSVTKIYDLATSEFAQFDDEFKTVLRFHKNHETLSVEVNYEDTWNSGLGFPVFSPEDSAAGTHLLREGLRLMGAASISVIDASLIIGIPRQNPEQALNPKVDIDRLRLEVQALVSLIRIIASRTGYKL